MSADGSLDGTFTVTLSAGSGNRTVTRLDLTRSNQSGIWDTQPNNGFWVSGAASTLDAALFNAANGSVNFPLTAGRAFKIFASDFQGQLFVPGSSFTLTVSFADGSTATANVSIGGASIALSFDGQIRDRVGQGETALSADGSLDGTFTVTLSAGSGNRTVTRLDLARAGSGNWDTQLGNGFWVVGAASTLDAALFNAANGTVNFPLTAGSSFKLFASDY